MHLVNATAFILCCIEKKIVYFFVLKRNLCLAAMQETLK